MFSVIKLNTTFAGYQMEDSSMEMRSLERINIFVGRNNSGKSRLLRNIFRGKDIIFKIDLNVYNELKDEWKSTKSEISNIIHTLKARSQGVGDELVELDRYVLPTFWDLSNSMEYSRGLVRFIERSQHIQHHVPVLMQSYKKIIDGAVRLRDKLDHVRQHAQSAHFLYVPALRGLRPLADASKDIYLERTSRDYFADLDLSKNHVFTGLGLYDEVKNLLLGTLSERRKVAEFESFLSKTFFNGEEFSITPKHNSDVLHVRIGPNESDEMPIFDLGDGIQAIIILTYPLFFQQGENCIFASKNQKRTCILDYNAYLLKLYGNPSLKASNIFLPPTLIIF